ncbi:MAG: hypothetical protein N2167_02100 [Flavobacteriales bacterium]|nr:hypothetical protein [Flavobacteriales bacterium]
MVFLRVNFYIIPMGTLTPFLPVHLRAVLQREKAIKTSAMMRKTGSDFLKNLTMI